MGIAEKFLGLFKSGKDIKSWAEQEASNLETKSAYYGHEYPVFEKGWDAEKTQGELGAPVDYDILHYTLSVRSWQIFLESDIAKLLINGYVNWVVGAGLTLQAEPKDDVIENNGFDKDKYVTIAEARFRLHAISRKSSYNARGNMHALAAKALKAAIVGGDVLVIFRYQDGVNIELVDGRNVGNPFGTDYEYQAEERGNCIKHGVEINKKGEHVAYYVKDKQNEWKRVVAKGRKTGRIQACLIYGDEYRVDDVRGLPLYSASIEKLKKIDRYIEACVSGTEERSKVSYYTHHNHFSDGTDPLAQGAMSAYTDDDGKEVNISLDEMNRQITRTINKMAVNMPPGSELRVLDSTVELNAGKFTKDMVIYISASLGLPYEVAVMMYENSFSASRMASQSWQHIMDVKRDAFCFDFYKIAYDIQLEMDILNGKINAPGYLQAMLEKDYIQLEAYRAARFVGTGVPQADPSKEVKASVLKIQNYLSSIEKETEYLGSGDAKSNIEQLGKEFKKIMEVIPIEYQTQPNPEKDSSEFTEEPEA